MKYALLVSILISTLLLTISSCKNDKPDETKSTGHISFSFTHLLNGQALERDTMMYTNAAGNKYEINQLMYFISDVTLHKSDGSAKLISDWTDIHYVDVDIPETLTWDVFDDIPAGAYDSISFTFGITKEKNQSFRFVNAPEVNMMWPDILGGGYHYMMINGSWIDNTDVIRSFAFHLGIGQLYRSNVIEVDSIYAFVQNYFNVKLPNSSFTVEENKTRHIEIIMNVDSWFETPHIYNHNIWGGAIMQNQQAMQIVKENGYDAFKTGTIK